MTGRPRTSRPPARARSAAALTRAPNPAAGGTGAGRSGGTGGPGVRNAGLGVTSTPDNRDERSAISANPSVRSPSVSGETGASEPLPIPSPEKGGAFLPLPSQGRGSGG